MPPPEAMETIMEVFNEDRIAHPWNPHVFVVPRLMTHLWRKHLGKDADLILTVTLGEKFWGKPQHEPLIVTVVIPLSHVNDYRGPWLVKGYDEAQSLTRELSTGFKYSRDRRPQGPFDVEGPLCGLWQYTEGGSRSLLRKFMRWARTSPPRRNVWCRYCESHQRGFDGAHLMGILFHCDLCAFRDLNFRDPVGSIPKDVTTLVAIRRANLDAMWARELETVKGNLRRVRRDYTDAVTLYSMVDPLPYLPMHKVGYRVGYKPALMTLAALLHPGNYTKNFQFSSTRKTSSWYGNVHEAGCHYDGRALPGTEQAPEKDNYFHSSLPTTGKWFRRFTR